MQLIACMQENEPQVDQCGWLQVVKSLLHEMDFRVQGKRTEKKRKEKKKGGKV